jgi:thiol-disulfide isomerase/thioredoxin
VSLNCCPADLVFVARVLTRINYISRLTCLGCLAVTFPLIWGVCVPTAVAQDEAPPIRNTQQEQIQDQKQDQQQDQQQEPETPQLTIGSKAPELEIEHWISNGEGKFPQVKQFQTGKIYVIEFWATWCPPCIAAIPHISKLQEKFVEKGVQIISVSDEDLETVRKFLERPVSGKEGEEAKTFADVTKNYCLTTDPDSSVSDSYLIAAGEDGIPTAFVVGKTGLIEWIGHPMELDEVLEQIVEDKWDRAAFAEARKNNQNQLEEKFNSLIEMFQQASELAEAGDIEEALAVLDEAIEEEKEEQWKEILVNARLQFVIAYVGGKEALKAFETLAQQSEDDPEEIGSLVLLICEVHSERPQDEEMLQLVRKTAEAAIKDNGEVIELQYGLGRILFLSGELDKSLAALEKTVKLIDAVDAEYEEEEQYYEELEIEVADWIAKVKEARDKK